MKDTPKTICTKFQKKSDKHLQSSYKFNTKKLAFEKNSKKRHTAQKWNIPKANKQNKDNNFGITSIATLVESQFAIS